MNSQSVTPSIPLNGTSATPSASPSPAPVPPVIPGSPGVVPAPQCVQNALTWIMTIKSPDDYNELNALVQQMASVPREQNPIAAAADTLGIIHFLRFVFLENNTKLAVITIYDGDFDSYVNEFVNQVGPIFDAVLTHMADAPPLPTQTFRKEFNAYVRANDAAVAMFYSAYPTSTVLDILSNVPAQASASDGKATSDAKAS